MNAGKDINHTEFHDYLPHTAIKSDILTYEEFSILWMKFPEYVKIRIPQLIFSSSTDGNNVEKMFSKT
jgi:hypothetical protein